MKNKKQELLLGLYEIGILEKERCTMEEEKQFEKLNILPNNVFQNNLAESYKINKPDLTDNELFQLILAKQTKWIRTLKDSVIFSVILSILLIVGITIIVVKII
jgi:hypothetical protein